MTAARFDPAFLEEVRARTGLVDLIGRHVKLKKRGREHEGLCPFHGERTPSFTVSEAKGFYHCFGCGAHGDAIGYLMRAHDFGFAEAVEHLAVQAGLRPDREGRRKPVVQPLPRQTPEADLRERDDGIRAARDIWFSCQAAPGTLVEVYLAARGITLPPPPSLRFHPGLKHGGSGLVLPAMVAAVQDPAGQIVGIHRTFLREDGRDKAPVSKPKRTRGAIWGNAVRLSAVGPEMCSGEGIETTLSVMQIMGLPGWAAISLGNMAGGGEGRGRPRDPADPWLVRQACPRCKAPGQADLEPCADCGRKRRYRLPAERPDLGNPGLLPPAACKIWIWLKDADGKDQEASDCLMERAQRKVLDHGTACRAPSPPPGCDFNDMIRPGAAL